MEEKILKILEKRMIEILGEKIAERMMIKACYFMFIILVGGKIKMNGLILKIFRVYPPTQ